MRWPGGVLGRSRALARHALCVLASRRDPALRRACVGLARPWSLSALKARAVAADALCMFDVKPALRELVEKNGSDLHLKVGSSPLHRVMGELILDTH